MMRRLEFEKLVSTLTEEHWEIKEALKRFDDALDAQDSRQTTLIAMELIDLLRQHMVDEEAQVLKLLIETYGKEHTDWAIQSSRSIAPSSN